MVGGLGWEDLPGVVPLDSLSRIDLGLRIALNLAENVFDLRGTQRAQREVGAGGDTRFPPHLSGTGQGAQVPIDATYVVQLLQLPEVGLPELLGLTSFELGGRPAKLCGRLGGGRP